jgi:hypothetical protein
MDILFRPIPPLHRLLCHRCPSSNPAGRYNMASLAAFTGRALMIFRAGLALNIVGSFVNGLMPFRAFVAGVLYDNHFGEAGHKEGSRFLEFFVAYFGERLDDALHVL